jgi:hypothetical protein
MIDQEKCPIQDKSLDLESHLASWACQDKRYEYINAVWITSKHKFSQELEAVSHAYSGYSRHDASHSAQIISAIEKMLGQDRIMQLSATDTWLLLMCAYTHDIGMIQPAKELFGKWITDIDMFNEWITNEVSQNRNLWEQLEFLYPLLEQLAKEQKKELSKPHYLRYDEQDSNQLFKLYDEDGISWPINLRNALSSLSQAYHRRSHAEASGKRLMLAADTNGKLCNDGIIPVRLLELIPKIAAFHGDDRKNLEKIFEQETKGIANDDAHPRFVAEMIRLGDLLDLDSNRFSSTIHEVTGDVDRTSIVHMIKHSGVVSFDIRPERIFVGAHYSQQLVKSIHCAGNSKYHKDSELVTDAVKSMLWWLDSLKQELDYLTIHWHDIIPRNFPGAAPTFDSKVSRDKLDAQDIDEVNLHYEIDARRAAELIEGTNMYRQPGLVFLRETVQNAVDSTKRQLYYDIRSGYLNALAFSKCGKKLVLDDGDINNPYDVFKTLGKSAFRYGIEIDVNRTCEPKDVCKSSLSECCEKEQKIKHTPIEITIRDHGVGINLNKLKHMQYVGNIFDKELLQILEIMPPWMRPTGSFGYGMQSIFRNVRSFRMKTAQAKRNGHCEGLCATFYSSRFGGEIYYEPMKECEADSFGRGTQIIVELDDYDADVFLRNAKIDAATPNGAFDIYGDKLEQIQIVVGTYLDKHCSYSGFPLRKLWCERKEGLSRNDAINKEYEKGLIGLYGDFHFSRKANDPSDCCGNISSVREHFGLKAISDSDREFPLSFSVWDESTNILLKYTLIHSKNETVQEDYSYESMVSLYFKGILVEDTDKIHSRIVDRIISESIAIPNYFGRESLWTLDAHIMGFETSKYIAVSRDRFLSKMVPEVTIKLQKINISLIREVISMLNDYYNGTIETADKSFKNPFCKSFVEIEENVIELFSSAYFMLPNNLSPLIDLMLNSIQANGEASSFSKFPAVPNDNGYGKIVTKKVPIDRMPFAFDPWCEDRRNRVIGTTLVFGKCSIPEGESLYAIQNIWGKYHSCVAIDKMHLLRPFPRDDDTDEIDYWRLYHLTLRDKVGSEMLEMDEYYYWEYAFQVLKNGRNPGRIILPGITKYKAITVNDIPNEIRSNELSRNSLRFDDNRQFPNWLILPVSNEVINHILKPLKLEGKSAELEKEIERLLVLPQNTALYNWVMKHSVEKTRSSCNALSLNKDFICALYRKFMIEFLSELKNRGWR